MSHSGCQPQTVADLLDDDDWKSFADVSLSYGAFEGLADLRQAIADQYDSVEPAHVLTFNGPSEAIYTFMRAMLKAHDTVVVQTPLFRTLHSIARHTSASGGMGSAGSAQKLIS